MEYKDTTIKNVSDYLVWVKETNSVETVKGLSLEHGNSYYRGQACLCWELKPSVLREPPYLDEHSLLSKAELRLWNEVASLETYLEKMILFQHYGLCTRLLDVTFNPLIALYMACCEEETCDGVVYCGYHTECKNSNIAELTAKYVFKNEIQRTVVGFLRFTESEGVKINNFTQPLFIFPPINNPRIEAQNGAFIMAPLFEKVSDDGTAQSFRKGLDVSDFFDNRRVVIHGNIKADILHELSVLGIDSGTIYKGTEGKLKAIVTEEKWKSDSYKKYSLCL